MGSHKKEDLVWYSAGEKFEKEIWVIDRTVKSMDPDRFVLTIENRPSFSLKVDPSKTTELTDEEYNEYLYPPDVMKGDQLKNDQ